jgi:hypothetical protein
MVTETARVQRRLSALQLALLPRRVATLPELLTQASESLGIVTGLALPLDVAAFGRRLVENVVG